MRFRISLEAVFESEGGRTIPINYSLPLPIHAYIDNLESFIERVRHQAQHEARPVSALMDKFESAEFHWQGQKLDSFKELRLWALKNRTKHAVLSLRLSGPKPQLYPPPPPPALPSFDIPFTVSLFAIADPPIKDMNIVLLPTITTMEALLKRLYELRVHPLLGLEYAFPGYYKSSVADYAEMHEDVEVYWFVDESEQEIESEDDFEELLE